MDDRARQIAELPLDERIAAIDSILKRLDHLELQVGELSAKVKQNSSNSSRPPSSDPPGKQRKRKPPQEPSGRKRGGQSGHPRHGRQLAPPELVAETVCCKPGECRQCGAALAGDDPQPMRHQVAELPPITPRVVEYQIHQLACRRCGQRTRGWLPPGVSGSAFGPRLTAILALLAGGCRLGKRTVRELAEQLFGLTISLGMICKLERRVAEALASPVAEIADHVRRQHVHVDETSWREDKQRCWLWVVVAPLATLFRIAGRRTADVAKELLGETYRHVANADRHGAYHWIGRQQKCWAHLRRDFQAMIDRGGPGQPIGEELLAISSALFEWWHRVRDGTMARSTFQRHVRFLRDETGARLEEGCLCGCPKTQNVCKRLLVDEPHFWTFASVEGVEPTNNAAERTINVAVRYRKMSGGTDSSRGSRFVERVLSVLATCRQQRRNALDYLIDCVEAQRQGSTPPSLLPRN